MCLFVVIFCIMTHLRCKITFYSRIVSSIMERNERVEVIMAWSPDIISFGPRWTFFCPQNCCFTRFLSHCSVFLRRAEENSTEILLIFNYCTRWDLSCSTFHDTTPCSCFLTMRSNAACMLHIKTALKNGIYLQATFIVLTWLES